MRHRKHRFQLGVKKEHREAMMAALATALLKHGRIETTLAKAKALRPFVEKIITLAKKAHGAEPARAVYLRRLAIARVRDKDAVHLLFDQKAEEFLERNGGYTRIYKLDRRVGDAAEMALIEMIDSSDEGYEKRKRGAKRAAAAGAAAAADGETATAVADEDEAVEVEADEAEVVAETDGVPEADASIEESDDAQAADEDEGKK